MNNYKKGICSDCEKKGENGFVQFDKINNYYYCMDCLKTWEEDVWESLKQMDTEDYKEHTADENLSYLNSL